MTKREREEIQYILDWIKSPVPTYFDHAIRLAVKCFLHGRDAQKYLEKQGMEAYIAERAVVKARTIIGNERAGRRMHGAEITKTRQTYVRKVPTFTHENFRVTIDNSQDRNYGMANVSIYAVVEVWEGDDEVEKEYLINFSDFKTKEWLTRLMVWALMNKREIVLKPANDEDMGSMPMFTPKEKSLT